MPSSTESDNSLPALAVERGRGWIWAGRVLSALVTLLLLFDAVGKITMPPQVMDSFIRLGMSPRLSPTIALLLLVSTVLYAIPWTAIIGAVLLTGYLGGAVAIHLRSGSSLFETIFPALFGVLVWAGIYLREGRLRELFPIRFNC
jgi:DoxX-like family